MEYVKYDPKQRAEFKKNLKRLMNEKGVTKTQLSKKLGWSYNTIDYWIRGDRVPDRTGIEAICDYFGIDDVELLGSEMKVRTFAYYKNDTLLAFGTMEEIAEQTGRKIESLRSLLCNSKRFNKTTKTYMIELDDDRRYRLKFKQSFTIDELNLKGIGWLLESPLGEVEEVEEGYNYLNRRISLDSWFFSGESEPLDFRVKHTRKELEEAGFGEVFNSPLFEVEEVE